MEIQPDKRSQCPVCRSFKTATFFEAKDLPAQDGVVWPSKKSAISAPTGDVQLNQCHNCDYIYNQCYDREKITFLNYDFSLHYSKTYQKFVKSVIKSLIHKYDLYEKSVLEVACGRGHFLAEFCKMGRNMGLGIDPSYEKTEGISTKDNQVIFEKGFYPESHGNLQVDFLICRHLVDELDDPIRYLKYFAQNLVEKGVGLYIEVPNAIKTFSEQAVWNVGFGKRSYYTVESFQFQLQLAGLRLAFAGKYLNDDYLGIEAVPNNEKETLYKPKDDELQAVTKGFQKAYTKEISYWTERLAEWHNQELEIALWGAGMRGINFLNVFRSISLVIDINPHRQNKFLPRSGLKVLAPEVLLEKKVDVILVSNSTYTKEIARQSKALGFRGIIESF